MAGPLIDEPIAGAPPRLAVGEDQLVDPSWFEMNVPGFQASVGEAMTRTPGYFRQQRDRRLQGYASQLAKATDQNPNAYSVPMAGEPISDTPVTDEIRVYNDLNRYRKANPGAFPELGLNPNDFDAKLRAEFAATSEKRGKAMARQGWLGNLAGGVVGSFYDPANALTMGFGAGPTAGIARAVITEGLINLGVEVAETPFVAQERKEQGAAPLTTGEIGTDWWTAFVGGAAFKGVEIAGGKAISTAVGALPENIRNLPRDMQMAAAARAMMPEDFWTPAERAAINVLERRGEIEISSPYVDDLSAGFHAERVDRTINELAREPVPTSEKQRWTVPNKPVAQMTDAELRQVGFSDQMIASMRGQRVEQPPIGTRYGPEGRIGGPPRERAPAAAPGEPPGAAPTDEPAPYRFGQYSEADGEAPDPTLAAARPVIPETTPAPEVRPELLAPFREAEETPGAKPLEELPTQTLGDVTSTAFDAPAHPETGDQRLTLRPDEIAALREHGITIDDNGMIDAANIERLMAERARRQAAGRSEQTEPSLTEEGQRRLDARRAAAGGRELAPGETLPRKEAPIVRFRREAADIEASLPPVVPGYTRLWRAERPGDTGKGLNYTNDLPGIALPFHEGYRGDLQYLDVPTFQLGKYEMTGAAAPGAEFHVPADLAASSRTARPARTAEAPRPTPAEQDALDAAGLGDQTPIDPATFEPFSEPGGEGSQAVAEHIWHDLRALEAETEAARLAAEARDPAKGKVFRTGAGGEAEDLLTFIARKGGLKDDIGVPPELREGHNLRGRGKLVSGAVSGQRRRAGGGGAMLPAKVSGRFMFSGKGMTVDEAAEAAWAAGFFGPPDEVPRPTVSEMIDHMVDSVDKPLYHPDDLAAAAGRAERRQAGRLTEGQNAARGKVDQAATERGIELDDQEIATIGDAMIKYDLDADEAIADHINRLAAEATDQDFENVGYEPDYERAVEPGAAPGDRADEAAGAPPGDAGGYGEAGRGPDNQRDAALEGAAGGGPVGTDGGQAPLAGVERKTVAPLPEGDTRGKGVQYHGARGELPDLTEGYYEPKNIYGGHGTFYTTDATDIAGGYQRKRGEGVTYRVHEVASVKTFDMEEKLAPEQLAELFGQTWHPDEQGFELFAIEEALGSDGKANLREVMDEMRDLSQGEGLTRDDVQDIFDNAIQHLSQQGYGAMHHIGGLKTGREPHNVKIYFDAPNQVRLTPNRIVEKAPPVEAPPAPREPETPHEMQKRHQREYAEALASFKVDRDGAKFQTVFERQRAEREALGAAGRGETPPPAAEFDDSIKIDDVLGEAPPAGLDLGAAVDPNIRAKTAQELDIAAQQPLRGERKTGQGQSDIMPAGLFGGAEAPGLFDLGDGLGARPIADIDAELKAGEAGIAAARKCLL